MVASAGGVWADQLIHWRRYRHHWLTLPLLALVTAVFAILGLVPLMNNFAHIAGFVAGFLACSIALLNRRVSSLSQSSPAMFPRRSMGRCANKHVFAAQNLAAFPVY